MTVYLDLDDLMSAAVAARAPAEVLVRDLGLLESALARPRASAFGEDAYPELVLKAAALLESIARNRALIDGNKRLAWTATRYFLIVNGADARPPTPRVGDQFVRAVARGQVDLSVVAETLASWAPPRS